jgi:hypothetical protein
MTEKLRRLLNNSNIRNIKKNILGNYDTIIFGSGLYAEKIEGINIINKESPEQGLDLTHRVMRGTPGKPAEYIISSALSIWFLLRVVSHGEPVSALKVIPSNLTLPLSYTASLVLSGSYGPHKPFPFFFPQKRETGEIGCQPSRRGHVQYLPGNNRVHQDKRCSLVYVPLL